MDILLPMSQGVDAVEEFEIQDILDKKKIKEKTYYLILYKGYEEASWQNHEDLNPHQKRWDGWSFKKKKQ